MKASSLAKAILAARPAFLAVYCSVYGGSPDLLPQQTANFAPPNLAHADQMGKTFAEWAEGLDRDGIEVHQEGASARFSAVEHAPVFGRHPGAVAARAKAAQFYRALIQRAVEMRGAHSFTIPAASEQGYAVACHEALAAVGRYRAALASLAALPPVDAPADRPELAAVAADARKKAEADVGRAVAMHTTACAEAIAAGFVADHGPWFRVCKDDGSDAPSGVYVVGVEVLGVASGLLAKCHANLDPQHGGGVYGFGATVPSECRSACEVALDLARAGVRLPESARYVTSRVDPDALVAAMLLSGRIRPELISPTGMDALRELARLDDGSPTTTNVWQPVIKAYTVGDSRTWGPLGQLMIPGKMAPLWVLEAFVTTTLYSSLIPAHCGSELTAALETAAQHSIRVADAPATAARFTVDGAVAYASDLPVAGANWMAAYSRAPIAVLSFVRPGTAVRAYTVAVCRDVGPAAAQFVDAFERATGEPGVWAGPKGGTLTGSRGPTRLDLSAVVRAANQAARECGISPTQSSGQSPFALR